MIIPPNVNAHSYLIGLADGERRAKTRAFGAIRRAAEVARELDRFALMATQRNSSPVTCLIAAASIRRAIRAAIGSDQT